MDKQLFQDAEVIAYRPSLEHQKSVRTETTASPEETTSKLTGALASFLQNKPSSTLMALMSALADAETILSFLAKALADDTIAAMSFEAYKVALSSGDFSSALPYVEAHRDSIEGKTAVEVHQAIFGAVMELRELKRIQSTLFYGDENITKEQAVAMDQTYEHRLLEFEKEEDNPKINYLALSVDAVLGKTITGYSQVLSGYTKSLASLVTDASFYAPVTKTLAVDDTIVTLFQSVSEKNLSDQEGVVRQTKQQVLPRAIYQLAEKRNEVNRILLAKDTLDHASLQRSGILSKAVSVAREGLLTEMVELTKASISQTIYRDSYLKTLEEKDYYRKIYGSLV